MSEIRVRMAPSPTGNLHLGTAYTTLFNYLFAKKNSGKFILRIEDTDKERSKKEFEDNILDGLEWLKLNWDEGPFRQSERLQNYKDAADKLLSGGSAYYCFCTPFELEQERNERIAAKLPPVYSGKCRSLTREMVDANLKSGINFAIRFSIPEDYGMIVFSDLIHSEISFDPSLLGDMVIMRGNGIPLYNFAVVVDDVDMKITHVLRGDDHLSNTPKQILLFEALGAKVPEFAHWPSILNPDRIGKLSKRQGATSIDDYRKDGYLPEAILNYLALLGWTMPDEREIMSLSEMEETFSLKKMRLSSAAFDIQKLDWMNGEYIRKTEDVKLKAQILNYLKDLTGGETPYEINEEILEKAVPLIKERIKKLSDFIPLTDFLFNKPDYGLDIFKRLKIRDLGLMIKQVLEKMEGLKKPWEKEEFEKVFVDLAKELNLSNTQMFQLIRVAVSGNLVTPPLFECIKILGEDEVLSRVVKANEFVAEGGE